MAATITLSRLTGLFLLVTFLTSGQATYFEISDPDSGELCYLLDIEFSITLTAYKAGKEVGNKTLTDQHDDLVATGECITDTKELFLTFADETSWAIAYTPKDPYPVALYRAAFLIPGLAFPDVTQDQTQLGYEDPRAVYLEDANDSYLCDVTDPYQYSLYTEPITGLNFTVFVVVYHIQTQDTNFNGTGFGPPQVCDLTTAAPFTTVESDVTSELASTTDPTEPTTALSTQGSTAPTTTESATSNVTTTESATSNGTTTESATNNGTTTESAESTLTSTESYVTTEDILTTPSTAALNGPVNFYSVIRRDGVTCIAMIATFAIEITYVETGPEQIQHSTVVDIPENAIASGNCGRASELTQTLVIKFLQGWSLDITFARSHDFSKATPESFGIIQMTLTFVVDEELFPSYPLRPGTVQTITTTSDETNFPMTWDQLDVYRCESVYTMSISQHVKVLTQHLVFKAFISDRRFSLSGEAAKCDADLRETDYGFGATNTDDEESPSGFGWDSIVGVVICAVVVVALSSLLVILMSRARRRRMSYELMQ